MDYREEHIFSANNVDLCTDAYGDAKDPAILLIMGASASMLMWEENFCHQLAAGGRFVIRFDNRDVGRSSCCPVGEPNYSMQDMADDAVAVLDHYGIGRAHIVGASMGGMITQLFGLNHADRALTLTPIMSSPDPAAVTDAMAGTESRYTLSPPSAEVIAAAGAATTLDFSDRTAVLENRLQMFRVTAGSAYPYDEASRRILFGREIDRANNMASSQNHGLVVGLTERWHERLGSVQIPTLVIHGTEDPILPFDHGEAIADSIPGAKLLALPGVGHELPDQEVDKVVGAILDFTS
ncbi:MAG: alpha/beta hydrolase [Pseudomonadales bacterium]|jgi:pimeloyl-ACP methyl ester carboxylesterase|nr:alpha/beta hydrolase [Pseudomonadales bacterium]